MIEIQFTGERYTEESLNEGIAAENGWLDPQWSRYVLHNNAEDVRTFEAETVEDAVELIESYIGAITDNGRGTYYAEDAQLDPDTGDTWSYAAHVTAK